MSCTFCRVVSGEEPSRKIAQSPNFIAILDIAPLVSGDTIVMSKAHVPSILDLPDEQGAEFLEFVKRVANTMLVVAKADGFNLVANTGEAAGQKEFHAHLHIIPRKKDDNVQVMLGSHRIVAARDLDEQKDDFVRSFGEYPAPLKSKSKESGRFASRRF